MAWTTLGTVAPGDVLRANSGTAAYNSVIGNLNEFTVAYTSFTPTFANLTQGNGTLVARQRKIGRVVFFYVGFTFGSTSSMGGALLSLTLPYAAANIQSGVFTGFFEDAGTAEFVMAPIMRSSSTTVLTLGAINAAGSYGSLSGVNTTVPMTWTTNDKFFVSGLYEAAS
jgi:hypothetical protein